MKYFFSSRKWSDSGLTTIGTEKVKMFKSYSFVYPQKKLNTQISLIISRNLLTISLFKIEKIDVCLL